MTDRFITTWRDTNNPLQWDFYVSESEWELDQAVSNLKDRGVTQFTTHRLGDKMEQYSTLPKAPTS